MTTTTRAQRVYPTSAPAYYLGRPAAWWITALSARRRLPVGENVRPHRPVAAREVP